MELGVSLPQSQQSTTCLYPSQINPFLCPSQFWQAQLVSFLVGLSTHHHPRILPSIFPSIRCSKSGSPARCDQSSQHPVHLLYAGYPSYKWLQFEYTIIVHKIIGSPGCPYFHKQVVYWEREFGSVTWQAAMWKAEWQNNTNSSDTSWVQ